MAKHEAASAAVEAGSAATVASLPSFRITLNCPTYLAHRTLVVEAGDENAAWRLYCEANGIDGSDHERTIELTTEPITDLKPKK